MTSSIRGRFAPSPSGRMHLGNLFSALLAWLSVRSVGGTMVLRMEDLDPQRCSLEKGAQLAEDLHWLGLDWDEGYGKGGNSPPYCQSDRGAFYQTILTALEAQGLVYPCYCTRAQRLATSAPHGSDGTVLYGGRCRSLSPQERLTLGATVSPSLRLTVPDCTLSFVDELQGLYQEHLPTQCGDFIIRRGDGVCAYQLAVVADDGAMGINQVVRGRDLLSSTPRQLYLYELLGYPAPTFYHVPLLCAKDGRRLAKRDGDLDMGALKMKYTPEELLGLLSCYAGQQKKPTPITGAALISIFSWDKVPTHDITVLG